MKILRILILLGLLNSLNAQVRYELAILKDSESFNKLTEWQKIVKSETLDFITISIKSTKENNNINYRTRNDIGKVSEWMPIEKNHHAKKNDKQWISELYFLNKNIAAIQLKNFENIDTLNDRLVVYLALNKNEEPKLITKELKSVCECIQPTYLDRLSWCPNGDCPTQTDPVFTDVSHLIVHHSFSSNVTTNWPAVVRSIWDYHVNTNGWEDIGYNWLIDPNGNIYEGRANDIRGAHFCGTNSGTQGFCVLGNFEDVPPQQSAIDSLTALLAWKSCEGNLNPLSTEFHTTSGLELNTISGHRQGCNTECPGDQFFLLFDELRNETIELIEESCSAFNAPSNLTAELLNETTVQLDWEDNSDNEDNFIVERSIWDNSSFENLVTLPANTSSFIDETVMPNAAYFYKIKARNNTSDSKYSNEVGIATVLLGTSETDSKELRIFPNPSSDLINIESANSIIQEVQILNSNGKLVEQMLGLKNERIILKTLNLPNGKYFIIAETKQGRIVRSIDIIK